MSNPPVPLVRQSTDQIAAAIAQHLSSAATLLAATADNKNGGGGHEAEIIARLDLILAKLGSLGVPLDAQLWTLAEVANYLRKHVETVRETMASLPSFPTAIRLPARNGARGHALYRANEVIKWAMSYQEKRQK